MKSVCFNVTCWIIQILLWCSMIFFTIVLTFNAQDLSGLAIGFLVFFYIFYLIINCCSPLCSYLFHKHGADSIHTLMKDLYYNAPSIEWHVECYHHETTYHTSRDSKGESRTTSSEKKVTTYRETIEFPFYTWRDVSGLFLLDSHKVLRSENKVYIKLELNLDINLADDMTRFDYQRQKDNFYNLNRYRDTHISFWETKSVSGFNKYNMVRISDYRPSCVNKWMFLLFTLVLPFVEFFKLYVDQFCIEQDYKIKKVVSSRYNLQAQEHAQQWEGCVPTMTIFDQPAVVYNHMPTPMMDYPEIPSMEEIEQSRNFSQGGNVNINFNSEPTNTYQPHFQNENVNGNIGNRQQEMITSCVPALSNGYSNQMNQGQIGFNRNGNENIYQVETNNNGQYNIHVNETKYTNGLDEKLIK